VQPCINGMILYIIHITINNYFYWLMIDDWWLLMSKQWYIIRAIHRWTWRFWCSRNGNKFEVYVHYMNNFWAE
jgi:hypothetical protein